MDLSLKSPNGRLREAGALRILELRAQGYTYMAIASQLGVSLATVSNVIKGRSWGWIREVPQ